MTPHSKQTLVIVSLPCCCTLSQVAYHGVPEKAYEVFVDALQSAFLNHGVKIAPMEDHNPAGPYIHSP